LPSSARCSGTEANHYGQCAIDFPKLVKRQEPVGFAQPGRVDGTELFNQDPYPLTSDFHFGPE
jgi:hypothetical protein